MSWLFGLRREGEYQVRNGSFYRLDVTWAPDKSPRGYHEARLIAHKLARKAHHFFLSQKKESRPVNGSLPLYCPDFVFFFAMCSERNSSPETLSGFRDEVQVWEMALFRREKIPCFGGIRCSTGALGPECSLLPCLESRAHQCLAASNPNRQLIMLPIPTAPANQQEASTLRSSQVAQTISGTIVGERKHNDANTRFRGNNTAASNISSLCRTATKGAQRVLQSSFGVV